MKLETKFISLEGFKGLEDEGPGQFAGYPSVFGDIDEGGDIIPPGAYIGTIPKFLQTGFTAHSHEWGCDGAIGFPIEAREDRYGLYCVSQFHSTEDAQNVRIKVCERLKAGKSVGLSIGYRPKKYERLFPEQYEVELPKYLNPVRLAELMEKAKRFPFITILHEIELFEYSIVTMPMQHIAQVTEAKSLGSEELTMDEHSESVLATVKSYTERVNDLALLRAKEGRVLSSANRERLRTHHDQLIGAAKTIKEILDATEPKQYIPHEVVEAILTMEKIGAVNV